MSALDFENTAIAFDLKSDAELERAYYLFKLISKQPLVRIGTAVTNLALKAHLPIEGLIRATVFDHFCGGVSASDCSKLIKEMYTKGVSTVLDFSVEGKSEEIQFDFAVKKTKELIDFASQNDALPMAVFKPTAVGYFELYEVVSKKEKMTAEQQQQWTDVLNRYHEICKYAKENNVAVLIDAEESWIQDAIDQIVQLMMQTYNSETAIVFNTVQAYRKDRFSFVKSLHADAQKNHYKCGIKLVRGAYMEKERNRAKELHYPSPICDTKLDTDKNFNSILEFLMSEMNIFYLFLGTHNEKSTLLAVDLLQRLCLKKQDKRIWFGQLYGMSDHISYNLSAKGYNVAKYVPFGPVRDVLPYLMRRAEENTSVAGQTNRELDLLKKERKRRYLD